MKNLAAVLVETGKPLQIWDLAIPVLKPGQVLVKLAFSGVCHTQLLECRGYRGEDKFLPHCLGHEGSASVVEISEGVKKVKKGDLVIVSWIKGTGADVPGTVYQGNGKSVNAGGVTTFSQYSVVSENRLTVIPGNMELSQAAMIGCVVPTGLGAVLNTAKPTAGQSLAVFGCGGVGLCSVAAAVIAGCKNIIAVDVLDDKLNTAKKMGANFLINASKTDPVKEINKICPGGVDFAVEASGRASVMEQAIYSVRSRGGSAVIVGNARFGDKLSLDPGQLNQGKRLLGTWGGDSVPDRDYLQYCNYIINGKLDLKPLMSKFYSLNEVNQALDDLESGKAIRPLIDLSI